ncbi:MAG: DUF2384 domain-containing protein [Gemmatimonadales bacterium]|nr:DUF2384 domain-containing protein [Gemmatimonadales bacterium]
MAQRRSGSKRRLAFAQARVDAGEVVFGSRTGLAEWAGSHRSQITRAAKGQEIGGEAGWRVAGLAAVVTALLGLYEADAVAGWMHGANPHLRDRRPLDVLAEGDVAAVMAAVQAARTGAYA